MTVIIDSNVAAQATQESASAESLVPPPLETLNEPYIRLRTWDKQVERRVPMELIGTGD